MKTITITLTTNRTNMDRQIHQTVRGEKEALAFLIGFINTQAEYGRKVSTLKSIEVK